MAGQSACRWYQQCNIWSSRVAVPTFQDKYKPSFRLLSCGGPFAFISFLAFGIYFTMFHRLHFLHGLGLICTMSCICLGLHSPSVHWVLPLHSQEYLLRCFQEFAPKRPGHSDGKSRPGSIRVVLWRNLQLGTFYLLWGCTKAHPLFILHSINALYSHVCSIQFIYCVQYFLQIFLVPESPTLLVTFRPWLKATSLRVWDIAHNGPTCKACSHYMQDWRVLLSLVTCLSSPRCLLGWWHF